ncbi:MAG: hypothetical protein J7497_05875 [Chitinophagaceae bacterium]|nr:hypothetical protein [Chitinophagaceae bacterium]
MRNDYAEIQSLYTDILPILNNVAAAIEKSLKEIVADQKHIDRITCRCKALDSFMAKVEKRHKNGEYKYEVPMKEIQDKIGARIIVYYKSDIEPIKNIITTHFKRIEEQVVVPDNVSQFGYEGFHMICKIPNTIYQSKNTPLVGDFFELQIKTLYQHAWSQSNHGLGYKPGEELEDEQIRLLAFIAAQSWGADKGLNELVSKKGSAS